MVNLKEIEENYRRFHTAQLLKIAKSTNELAPEVVEILHNELRRRGEQPPAGEAEQADDKDSSPDLSKMSFIELRQYITERMSAGEEPEAIRFDLSQHDIDINQVLDYDEDRNSIIEQYLEKLKKRDVKPEIRQQLMAQRFNLTETETEIYNDKMKAEGELLQTNSFMVLIVAIVISMFIGIVTKTYTLLTIPVIICAYIYRRGGIMRR